MLLANTDGIAQFGAAAGSAATLTGRQTEALGDATRQAADLNKELGNGGTYINDRLNDEQRWAAQTQAVIQARLQLVAATQREEALINSSLPVNSQELVDATNARSSALSKYNELLKDRVAGQTKDIRSGKLLTYTYQLEKEELDQLRSQYGTTSAALEDFRQDRANILQLLQSGDLSGDQAFRRIEEGALKVIATKGPWAEYWAGLKKDIGDFESFSIGVFDEFKNTLVDAIVTGNADWSGFVDYL
jgi:chromosome segregation ATPase